MKLTLLIIATIALLAIFMPRSEEIDVQGYVDCQKNAFMDIERTECYLKFKK